MYEKLKSFLINDTIFMAVLVSLVAVVSFGLGRQSVVGESLVRPAPQAPASVIFTDVATTAKNPEISTDSVTIKVVGSRSGTKYHLPNCPGAAQIKEENKVFFDSAALAEAAGYSPAANCPGLQ
jgi:hypothetical protein